MYTNTDKFLKIVTCYCSDGQLLAKISNLPEKAIKKRCGSYIANAGRKKQNKNRAYECKLMVGKNKRGWVIQVQKKKRKDVTLLNRANDT